MNKAPQEIQCAADEPSPILRQADATPQDVTPIAILRACYMSTRKVQERLSKINERWHAAAAPHLLERPSRLTISAARTDVILLIRRIVRPFRAWPSGSLLEFLQLRSFDRRASVSSSFLPPPSLGRPPFLRRGRAEPGQQAKTVLCGSFGMSELSISHHRK
jgi:hypothetical protein